MIGSTKVDLFDILLKDYFRGNLPENQKRLARTLAPLLALGSKYTSVSAGFLFVSPGCTYDLFSGVFFLLGLSLLILSLPLLGLGSKPTSLSPGFCVCRPKQYNMICWEFDLLSRFFVSSWLIVWEDGINRCGWCLVGGRGC